MFTYTTIKNFLTEEECNQILNFSLNNLKLKKAEIGSIDNRIENLEVRNSQISFYEYDKEFPYLRNKISDICTKELNQKGFEINFSEQLQFTEYKTGQFYNWHTDNGLHIKRYCSIVIQLNKEYVGGNLEILDENLEKKIVMEPGIGNMFIFLSNLKHRVTEVTNGTRYSLVSWLSLKENKNYKKTLI